MGNYTSCALRKTSVKPTNVIFPSGEIRAVGEATKAAELMLEAPNSFIVDTKSMQIGRRFAALNADEDLEMGSAYVFFPMSRLNTAVTAADLAVLFLAASSKRRGGGRIAPCDSGIVSRGEAISAPRLSLGDIEEYSTAEFKHRLSASRSKKPLLETIVEEPVCMR